MTPDETVMLARYVRALCPQQRFDEYTPDAWHDVLGDYPLADARTAAAKVARRQPFVSPAEIIDEIRKTRDALARDVQGAGQPAEVPDADPDDVDAYLAAVREQRFRAVSGLKPRAVAELLPGVGREIPPAELPKPRGPMGVTCQHCGAKPRHPCQRANSRGRMTGFHPVRIEDARRADAGQPPVDPAEQQAEIDRRIEASRRALAADHPDTPRSH